MLVSGFLNCLVEPFSVLVLGNLAVSYERDDDKAQKESDGAEKEHEVVVLVEQTDDKTAENRACYRCREGCGVIIAGKGSDKLSSADSENEREGVDVNTADTGTADNKSNPQHDPDKGFT